MPTDEFIGQVQQHGIAAAEISRQEKQQLPQQWRAVFAFNLRTHISQRKSNDRDWHVFSTKQATYRDGATALNFYLRTKVPDFFIVPQVTLYQGYVARETLPPIFPLSSLIYIFLRRTSRGQWYLPVSSRGTDRTLHDGSGKK